MIRAIILIISILNTNVTINVLIKWCYRKKVLRNHELHLTMVRNEGSLLWYIIEWNFKLWVALNLTLLIFMHYDFMRSMGWCVFLALTHRNENTFCTRTFMCPWWLLEQPFGQTLEWPVSWDSIAYDSYISVDLHACETVLKYFPGFSPEFNRNRVGQSREIYSNSVPLSPPHWPYPKRIRPPSWPRVAVASSIQNTKLFTWRTWPGAGAVPKCNWAARSQCGFKQRRADHTKYIWYVATHGQSVITTELMIAWIW